MIFLSVFCHFSNKHVIYKTARENIKLAEIVASKKDLNRTYQAENIELSALARIEHIAIQELGMEYPNNKLARHTILYNESKQTFSLLDFFIPTVEALTRK
jgi:cell division protein FtsL